MHISTRRVVVLASLISLILSVGLLTEPAGAAVAAGEAAGTASVTGPQCEGNTDTLSWTAPYDGVVQYRVDVQNDFLPYGHTFYLAPDQNSLQFPVQFGTLHFTVMADTMTQTFTPFASAVAPGFRAPQPMQWDSYSDGQNAVGDRSATVAFAWPANSSMYSNRGGPSDLPVSVTVTAAPGGASMTTVPSITPSNGIGVADAFTGLKNGVDYTFTSTVTNSCGSSAHATSAPITPKKMPALTCVTSGNQSQRFVEVQSASGLAAIDNLQVVNGTATVPSFATGTTDAVDIVLTRSAPGKKMTWSFDVSDVSGHVRHCT
jgi:hypothetical protein